MQQQTTTLAVGLSSDVIAGRLSGDGRYLAAFSSSGLVIRDRFAGVTSTPPGASTWMWPMLSGNGRYVVTLDTTGGGRAIVTPNPL
ncbi:MAG: hypothetical protein H7138_25375 [Myxococcales bacterium]|nr:hypothetical protein [Myxococcales bacterium]